MKEVNKIKNKIIKTDILISATMLKEVLVNDNIKGDEQRIETIMFSDE